MAKRDNERAARMLVEATLLGNDTKVAESYGVTLRTLQNYRAALTEDPELSALFIKFLNETEHQTWLAQLDDTMLHLLKKIMNGLELVEVQSITDLADLAAVMEALAEIRLSRDMYGVDEHQNEGTQAERTPAESAARSASAGAQAFGTN